MITKEQMFCGFFDSGKHLKNKTETQERIVSDYEIELFDSDGGTSFVDGRSHSVKRGMLLLVKPHQKRHSVLPVRCHYIRIHPRTDLPKELTNLLDSLPECVYLTTEQKIKQFLHQFEQLGQPWLRETPSPDPLTLSALFYDLMYQYRQLVTGAESAKSPATPSKIASDVRTYLNAHFHEECSLRVISRNINTSPNHLRAVFQTEFGISPYEYVLQKRIEQAKILIAAQSTSFTDIAACLGFCSQSHFNKLFKERVHCTPKEYQKRALKNYFDIS